VNRGAIHLSLHEALVQESRIYYGNLSAKVEEVLQAYVLSERQSRQHHREKSATSGGGLERIC